MLVTAYVNGATAGSPPPPRTHVWDHRRGLIQGWSRSAVRRHTCWLYSVESDRLDGTGVALTLTLARTPETHADWAALVKRWIQRVEKDPRLGCIRIHWVVEWTRRHRPHMHVALYVAGSGFSLAARAQWIAVLHWLDVTEGYGTMIGAQHGDTIDGPLGWLQYLSKHAARGVSHYQRWSKPSGWERTGRLWGHRGSWPVSEPMKFDMAPAAFYRYRRLVRSWRIAQARAAGDARRIGAARRMLSCDDRQLSSVRGCSEWAGESTTIAFLELLYREGFELSQRSEVADVPVPELRAADV